MVRKIEWSKAFTKTTKTASCLGGSVHVIEALMINYWQQVLFLIDSPVLLHIFLTLK